MLAVGLAAHAATDAVERAVDAVTGISSMVNDVKTIFRGNASLLDKVLAGADLLVNVVMDVTSVVGLGEGLKAAYIGMKAGAHLVEDAAVHAGVDAAEHVGEHEVEDQAAETAIKVATGEGASEPMEVIRTIQKGEKFADILDEAKTGMYLTGKEHAAVTLADGTRALVRGGRFGIDFGVDSIKNIFFHTHPWDDLARLQSDADVRALQQLGQASSHIYEHGQLFKFWNREMFP